MKPSVISNQVPAVRCTNSGKYVLYHSVSKLLGAPDWGLQVRHATAHVHNLLHLSFPYVIARYNFPREGDEGEREGEGARGARARARARARAKASVIRPDRQQPMKEPSLKYYNQYIFG